MVSSSYLCSQVLNPFVSIAQESISVVLFFLRQCYLHHTINPLFVSGLETGTGAIFGSCGEVSGCALFRNLDPNFCPGRGFEPRTRQSNDRERYHQTTAHPNIRIYIGSSMGSNVTLYQLNLYLAKIRSGHVTLILYFMLCCVRYF